VTVVVVDARACDRESRVSGCEKAGILLRRAVVRNLHNIGVKIGPTFDDRLLAGWFDIASEQQSQPGDSGHDHQAVVVLLGGFILACGYMLDRP
jgi:hypothetical protein